MNARPVRLVAVLLVGVVGACSSDEPVERSAESFCARYTQLAEMHDADVKTVAPIEQSSPDEVRSLADRAPDDELEAALEEIAEVQPDVIEFMEALQSGDADPRDVDREVLDRYTLAAKRVHDDRHRLCDE